MSNSWLKTGADSAAIAKQDEQEKEIAKASQGLLWRFSMKDKEEARITFVDGELSADGFLLPPRYYEHTLWSEAARTYTSYVCPEKTVPEAGHKCPLCAIGERSALVAVFTVIDHREIKTKAGKIIKDQRKLLVAKPTSMEMLTKIAVKRGGLAGCTFDVSRMGDKSAAIGSMYDFVEKTDLGVLQKSFVEEIEVNGQKKMVSLFTPADYAKEILFRTPEELLKLGVGVKAAGGYGNGMSPGGNAKSSDYSKDL